VFTGGLHPADTATVLRADGDDVLITDGPYPEGQGARRRVLGSSGRRIWTPRSAGRARPRPRASFPIEVRPMVDLAEG